MRKIILIYFSIISISCKNKNISEITDKNHIVSDKEIYSFLSSILKNQTKSITKCNNDDVLEFVQENKELKSMLTEKDLVYIKKQIGNENKFSINSEYLNDYDVIPEGKLKKMFRENRNLNTFWKEFENEYETESFFSISLPIFSLNKEIVIITTEVLHKEGFKARGKQVYRKVNGEWKLYKNFTTSIS
ncbi:hypothetical protein JJC03_16270 [Flavobacterium oreochromis]|uniref:hypothetical protein n=1 Tax=Flavobacterium oreochromis TaxID=2906078 RepID=UPI001CE4F9B7|nr:hypothetical protein [Flavobacterium oreochromis]QYS86432.1 hypothetical protein JJC03_16270 [Flavobacterium oreochromis]